MASPIEELCAKRQEFISIRELIIKLVTLHPTMSYRDAAEWIAFKMNGSSVQPTLLFKDVIGEPEDANHWDAKRPQITTKELLAWVATHNSLDTPFLRTANRVEKNEPVLDFDDDIPF